MHIVRIRRWLVVLTVCLVAAGVTGAAGAETRPLKILLTNDDGYDSTGLKVMQAALKAAGHTVTVVAPATNMSSSGMSMTSGAIKVESKGDGVWAVHGTPADAAMIGLAHILRDTPPDLVVSGTNAGQNLGGGTNSSGTVSAAIAAARYGVPAIATSASVGRTDSGAYETAATLAVHMIAMLDTGRTAGAKLLPDGLVINVNVPAATNGQFKGIVWAPLSTRSAFTRAYSGGGTPDEVRARMTLTPAASAEPGSDLALFGQGYITLTLLDGDLSAGAAAAAAITARLSALSLPQAVAVQ